jgi:hypothetical protein
MSENSVKFETLLESKNISVDDLTPKIQEKIANFDTIYDTYTDAEEGSVEEKEAFAKLKAMDEGITNDIQSFLDEKSKSEKSESVNDKIETNTQTNSTTNDSTDESQKNESNKPSWAFWL